MGGSGKARGGCEVQMNGRKDSRTAYEWCHMAQASVALDVGCMSRYVCLRQRFSQSSWRPFTGAAGAAALARPGSGRSATPRSCSWPGSTAPALRGVGAAA